MESALHELLKQVDTPTVLNAIEMLQGKRGYARFTRGAAIHSDPSAPPMVGYAATARIAGREPPTEPPDAIRERRMAYYRAMAEAPQPSVAVIEDMDHPGCVAAYWGELNTRIHKGFGIEGALTNGAMRDLGDMAPGFPVIAGSVGPSHGFVHVREIGAPVAVFGLTVAPGEIIHADRHGAAVIPAELLSRMPEGIARLQEAERIVLDAAQEPDFNFERFAAAWAAFEKART